VQDIKIIPLGLIAVQYMYCVPRLPLPKQSSLPWVNGLAVLLSMRAAYTVSDFCPPDYVSSYTSDDRDQIYLASLLLFRMRLRVVAVFMFASSKQWKNAVARSGGRKIDDDEHHHPHPSHSFDIAPCLRSKPTMASVCTTQRMVHHHHHR
jgi:hypothetical protein